MLLALAVASACSNNGGEGNNTPAPSNQGQVNNGEPLDAVTDPMAPYAETVKYTTVRGIDQNPQFPEGASWEANPVQDYIEKTLNVKGELLWTAPTDGEQYSQKVALDVASNEIPDIFLITGSNSLSLMNQLVEGDMIEDLTDEFEQYASEKVKGYFNSNPFAFQNAKFDGKLMGVPGAGSIANPMQVWVREDWRKKMSLPEPTTIENVRAVAKAFGTGDPDGNGEKDTIGLAAQEAFMSASFDLHTLDAINWSLKAFPMTWIEGEDGKVKWGGIQPEAKEALAVFREMYAEGGLDPAFGQKDGGQTTEDASAGKVGMVFQAWYAPYYPLGNTLRNDHTAEWKPYPLSDSEGNLQATTNPADTSFIVVRKGFEHPELAIKLLNLNTEISEQMVPELKDWYDKTTEAGTVFAAQNPAFMNAGVANPNDIMEKITLYKDILAGKADESMLTGKQVGDWAAIKFEQEKPWEDSLKDWQQLSEDDRNTALNNHIGAVAWLEGAGMWTEFPIVTVPNAFSGTSETMKNKWETLRTLQNQAYLQIILGSKDVDYFDTFVQEWKKQGGDQITAEVQEIVDKR